MLSYCMADVYFMNYVLLFAFHGDEYKLSFDVPAEMCNVTIEFDTYEGVDAGQAFMPIYRGWEGGCKSYRCDIE